MYLFLSGPASKRFGTCFVMHKTIIGFFIKPFDLFIAVDITSVYKFDVMDEIKGKPDEAYKS